MNKNLEIITFHPLIQFNELYNLYNLPNKISLFVDYIPDSPDDILNKSGIQILRISEPDEIVHLNKKMIEFSRYFDYIFTYENEVLAKINNGVLFEYGTKWVMFDDVDKIKKEKNISFVCGNKMRTSGHVLRKKIWYNQEEIKFDKKFFISNSAVNDIEKFEGNLILGEKKEPLFDSMFSLVVENVKKENFFTEKLIDCFLMKSIPIYYGADNIEKYFDVSSMILFNNHKDCIEKINNLSEDFYYNNLKQIDYNFKIAKKFINIEERFVQILNKIL